MFRKKMSSTTEVVERNLLWGLCKDYGNFYKVKRYLGVDDFVIPEFREIFLSIQSLYENSGFKKISKEIVESYCIDKGKKNESLERLQSFVDFSREVDIDFDGAYNQFVRASGMNKLLSKADKYGGLENMFMNMYDNTENADQLKNSFDSLNRECFKTHKKAIKSIDMGSGMVKFVKERMFSEKNAGIRLKNMPLLQGYVKGIHEGITGICSFSGMGKSTWAITYFSMAILENGEKLLSIHNEQEEDEIRQLYLMAYISVVERNNKGIHRNNLNFDNKSKITDEQMKYLIECAERFEKRYTGKLTFVFVPRFNIDDTESLLLEYKRTGHDNVLLDTLKSEDATLGWQILDNLANRLDGISKENKIKVIYTAQLRQDLIWRKYLDVDCVGKCKSLKDSATEFYLFRKIRAEEIPTITCSYWDSNKNWVSGIKLNPEKEYIAWFLNKTRHGEDDKVIIYQCDMGYQFLKEIGVTNSIKRDSGK